MTSPASARRTAKLLESLLVCASLTACAASDPDDAMPVAGADREADSETAPETEPQEPSDLATLLGGQTGSEMPEDRPDPCDTRSSFFSLTGTTPLGFTGQTIGDVLVRQRYQSRGLPTTTSDPEVELTVTLTAPVLFLDRQPLPDGSCLDALQISTDLDIVVDGEPLFSGLTIDVFAAAEDRFAARVSIPFPDLRGPLAQAAQGADVTLFVEHLADGVHMWFYANEASEPASLLGELFPTP